MKFGVYQFTSHFATWGQLINQGQNESCKYERIETFFEIRWEKTEFQNT